MGTIYRSMNMLKSNSLSTYKVLFVNFNTNLKYLAYVVVLLQTILLFPPGEAESGLERLHQCAEKELQLFLNADGPSREFNDFRTKLAGLTR